jgi:hypothetical protein
MAGHLVGFFTNHYTNVVEKDWTRVVPFFWEYFIPMDYITIEETPILQTDKIPEE